MKSVFLMLSCCLAYASAVSFYEVVSDEWVTWKLFHAKNYSSPVEDKFRLKIFMENKAKIARHNAEAHQGAKSYFLKMNSFGDLVRYEYHYDMIESGIIFSRKEKLALLITYFFLFIQSFTTNSLAS